MTTEQIMRELEQLGSESTKRILMNHGAKEPLFGVKVADLKTFQKKIKKNYDLSIGLYSTGNSDAMYLAGLIADEKKMSQKDLTRWAKEATGGNITEYTVPWITAESEHGWDLGRKWIDEKDAQLRAIGWATLANVVSITEDEALDLTALKALLERVVRDIHRTAEDRVRSAMNMFVICLGTYVLPLTTLCVGAATALGDVQVDKGDTASKAPNALAYLKKMKLQGRIGKKKKQARC